MKGENYDLYTEIIKRCRDCSELTNKTVALIMGTDTRRAALYMRKLSDIGCVKVIGRRMSQRYNSPIYRFDEYAVTRLKSYFFDVKMIDETAPPEVKERLPVAKVRCHAFEPGFGRSFINNIDAMLREVRCG